MCCAVPPSLIECKGWEGHCFPECKLTNTTNLPGSLSRITRGHTAERKITSTLWNLCMCRTVNVFLFFCCWFFLGQFAWIYNSCLMTEMKQMFSKHYWNIRIMAQFTPNTVIVWQVCLSPGIPSGFNTRGWSLGCLEVWKCICFLFVCLFFSQWFLRDWQPLQGVTLPLTHCTLGWAPASASHTLLTDWLVMNICIRGVYVSRL